MPTTLPNLVSTQIRQSTLFLINLQHFCSQLVQNSSNNKIRFGIIGYGHIGRKHAQEIQNNPHTCLLKIADKSPLAYIDIIPGVEGCSHLQELLDSPNIDVVTIATPNGTHADFAIQALNAGKHVVIEKPMALTTEDCNRIISASEKNEKLVFCVMQNRFSPPSIWLKQLLNDETLGTIHQVLVQCWWNRDHRYYTPGHWHGTKDLDGGVLFTQFSHFVDLLYWLFGDIQVTQAQEFCFNHQDLTEFADAGSFNFEFGSHYQGKGNFVYSTSVHDKNFESSITIFGEKGTVKIGGQYMNEIVYCHIHNYLLPQLPPTRTPNHYGNYIGSASNHEFVIQEIVNTLIFQQPIQTTALEGKAVVDIINQVHALAQKKN